MPPPPPRRAGPRSDRRAEPALRCPRAATPSAYPRGHGRTGARRDDPPRRRREHRRDARRQPARPPPGARGAPALGPRARATRGRSGTSRSAALFFLNASGQIPMPFVQALSALDYRPVLLSGPSDVKVVDVAIMRTLEALAAARPRRRPARQPRRRLRRPVASLAAGAGRGGSASSASASSMIERARRARRPTALEFYDLEDDVGAFTVALPRIRVIPIERFDPWTLLK